MCAVACWCRIARFVVGCSVLLTEVRGGRCGHLCDLCFVLLCGSCKGHGLHLVSSCVKVCMVGGLVVTCLVLDCILFLVLFRLGSAMLLLAWPGGKLGLVSEPVPLQVLEVSPYFQGRFGCAFGFFLGPC